MWGWCGELLIGYLSLTVLGRGGREGGGREEGLCIRICLYACMFRFVVIDNAVGVFSQTKTTENFNPGMVFLSFVLMIIAAVPAIFIKSKSTVNENYSELTLRNIGGSFNEIIQGFKEALKIKPFRKLCISTFFIFNAFLASLDAFLPEFHYEHN